MNTNIEIMKKRTYSTPETLHVKLDNEISLILESNPPFGPGELVLSTDHFNNDLFITTMS